MQEWCESTDHGEPQLLLPHPQQPCQQLGPGPAALVARRVQASKGRAVLWLVSWHLGERRGWSELVGVTQ